MMIAMCNSVYNQDNMFNTFDSFGFDKKLYADEIYTHYAATKKEMGNGETLVLVVVRGTGEPIEDIAGWLSNLDLEPNNKGQHTGFADAADYVYKGITENLGVSDFSNTKFVITGFSRGAAASNILAARLVDEGVSQKNVYAYTFACPDTAVITETKAGAYKCIFNIANINDYVSWVPRTLLPAEFLTDNWNKYGSSYWYCNNWSDYQNIKTNLIDTLFSSDSPHNQYKYLQDITKHTQPNFLTRNQAGTMLDNAADLRAQDRIKKTFPYLNSLPCTIHACPVDVEIYTSDNQLACSAINNVENNVLEDKAYIQVYGDKKYVYYLSNDNYTVKLTGTDTGTMTYSIRNINLNTNETIEEQQFANVVLANGKKFTSNIIVKDNLASEVKTEDVKLYVIDGNGNPEKEVLPDGNGTEVPINNNNTPTTPVTPNRPATPDNGGSSSNTNTSTGTSTVSPVGGTKTETMTVNINNKVTGKTSKVTAKKTGSSVTIKLGTENNGYYANVYTTNDEYICSALIENGRAEFNIPDGIKIKIVIDSIAYGEDVSSAAGISETDKKSQSPLYMIMIVIIIAAVGFSSIIIVKRFAKKKS